MNYLKLFEDFRKTITVYHGSNSDDIQELIPYTNNYGSIPKSIFLSSSIETARNYGDYIYECIISPSNIKTIDKHGESFHDMTDFEYLIKDAYNDDYDCVIFENIMDSKEPNEVVDLSDTYVVFDTNIIINITLL